MDVGMREKESRMMPHSWLAQGGGGWFTAQTVASWFERGLDTLSLRGVVDRIMAAQRCPHPNSPKSVTMLPYMANETLQM